MRVRDRYLARKGGLVTALMKALASAPPTSGPRSASSANELKQDIEHALDRAPRSRRQRRRPAGRRRRRHAARTRPPLGHRHPLTILREQIEAIFTRSAS